MKNAKHVLRSADVGDHDVEIVFCISSFVVADRDADCRAECIVVAS